MWSLWTTTVINEGFMKHLLSLSAALGLMACSSVAQTDASRADASPCIALKLECSGSGNILIVGSAEEHADLLNTALAASEKFEDTFDRSPAKTVIVPGGVISADMTKALKAAGYPVQLPWVSAADKAKLREASIVRQVEEQTKGLPQAVKESAMKQALAAVKAGVEDQQANALQAGAFAHELGHMWFINAFSPGNSERQTGHAYGGWAPDWLDETAAVLMENPALNKRRRAAFKGFAFEDVIPLAEFLTMEHPAAQSAKELRNLLPSTSSDGPSSESRAIVLTGKEAEEFLKKSGGNKAANFYAQVQVFSDFLLSYSDDTAIYISLTEGLLAGASFETWLAGKGQEWGLPQSVEALDAAWLKWIDKDQ